MAVDRIMADIQRRSAKDDRSYTIELRFIDGKRVEFDFLKCESGYLVVSDVNAPPDDVVFVPFAAILMVRPIWH